MEFDRPPAVAAHTCVHGQSPPACVPGSLQARTQAGAQISTLKLAARCVNCHACTLKLVVCRSQCVQGLRGCYLLWRCQAQFCLRHPTLCRYADCKHPGGLAWGFMITKRPARSKHRWAVELTSDVLHLANGEAPFGAVDGLFVFGGGFQEDHMCTSQQHSAVRPAVQNIGHLLALQGVRSGGCACGLREHSADVQQDECSMHTVHVW